MLNEDFSSSRCEGVTRRTCWIWSFVVGVGLIQLVGCSPPPATGPVQVSGTVLFQNRPLAGGLIVFSPDANHGQFGKALRATIQNDGTYVIRVEAPASASAVGWYRVAIADPPGLFTPELGYPEFPKALRRPDRSGLQREIKPGTENVFHFHIEITE